VSADILSGSAGRDERPATVRVWDPLVRLFHWGLVVAFFTAWFSDSGERVHNAAGYTVLGLVAFRLVWGIVGTRHARFSDFVASPGTLVGYLRDLFGGHPPHYAGHNPAGGLMILGLLTMVTLTAGSGWLMITDRFWGTEWVEELHEGAATLTLALIAMHVLGAMVSSWLHRENLVLAMITGRKRVQPR
jgi:cytochrome b